MVGLLAALTRGSIFADPAMLPSVQVTPLYRLSLKSGLPMPVAVDLENRAARFEGVLEAWIGSQAPGRLRVRRVLNLGPGRFRFWLYPRADPLSESYLVVHFNGVEQARILLQESVHVALPLPGHGAKVDPPPGPLDSPDLPRAYFPGEDPARPAPRTALASRIPWWAGLVAAPESGFPARQLRDSGFQLMALSGPESFPDRWYGFQALDVLIWDTHAALELTNPQRQAIREWIQAGGRLMLVGPESDARAQAPLPDLLPSPEDGCDPAIQTVPGVRVLDRRVGLGLVRLVVCETADLAALSEQDWARLADTPRPAIPARSFGKPEELLQNLGDRLTEGLSVPSLPLRRIIILLAVYGLAVSLLDYALLRLIRRLRWIWVAFPSLILVLSFVVYYGTYRPGLIERAETELEIRDLGTDGSGKLTRVSCVRLARAHPYELAVAPASAFSLLPSDPEGFVWPPRREGGQYLIESDSGGLHKTVAVTGLAGSERLFLEETPVPAGPPVFETSLSVREGHLAGRVSIPAGVGYTNVFLLYSNLLIGVTQEAELSSEIRQIEDFMHIPLHRWGSNGDIPEESFLDSLTEWVDLASEAALCASDRRGWEGVRTAVLPNDFLARWNAPADQAILFVFREHVDRRGGGSFRRVACVRQLVPVTRP
jgi:hypothetical protein